MLTWHAAERRCALGDRRRFSYATLYYGLLYGRRQGRRRRVVPAPVDRPDQLPLRLLLVTAAVFYLSLVDASLTLQLLRHGVVEVNPLMRLLINTHEGLFLAAKALLTAGCLVTLLAFRDHCLAGTLRVAWLLYAALGGYATLILYELNLYRLVA